jgi:outer membrane biosynthesis protein TonB
LTQN